MKLFCKKKSLPTPKSNPRTLYLDYLDKIMLLQTDFPSNFIFLDDEFFEDSGFLISPSKKVLLLLMLIRGKKYHLRGEKG